MLRAGQLAGGDDAAQVGVAPAVGRQADALLPAPDQLGPDDGLQPRRPGLLVEEHGPVEAVRVGQRHGGGTASRGGLNQLLDAHHPLQQAEGGMRVQVNEVHRLVAPGHAPSCNYTWK